MAKRFMKKAIAVFLSAIMVISSVPFFAVTAFAADDTLLTTADTAMKAYDNKMDGTIYTNMANAYKLYVQLNAMVDKYKYIGVDDGIAAKASELTTATNALTAFTSYTGNKYAAMPSGFNDNVSEADYHTTHKNILYAPAVNRTATTGDIVLAEGKVFGVRQANCFSGTIWYSPNAVMLYDGKTTPQLPVSAEFWSWRVQTYGVDTAELGCWISRDDGGLSINAAWNGRDTRNNSQWLLCNDIKSYPLSGRQGNIGTFYHASNNNGEDSWYANYLKFTSSMSDSEPYRKATPIFKFHGANGAQTANLSNYREVEASQVAQDTTALGSVYILNYKMLLDAMNKTTTNIGNVASYSHGRLQTLLEAIDAATAYNPTTADYSNTEAAVAAEGEKINTLTTNVNNAMNGLQEDTPNHYNLSLALGESKSTYDRGNADGAYEAASWTAFANAYEAAYTIIDNLPTNLYSDREEAKTAEAALREAKSNLKTVGKVDTANLEISIRNALNAIANKTIFTTSSYDSAALETLIPQIQTAVWGTAENFGVDAEKLSDTAENRTLVEGYATQVNNAIKLLVINVDAVSPKAGKSMTAAINDAQTYIDKGADYSNIAVLQTAVDQAKQFISTGNKAIDGSIDGAVSAQIAVYNTLTGDITNAIRNLRPSFSKITDGTYASGGQEVITQIESTHGDTAGNWKLLWTRPSGMIIFRTTHDEVTYDLPVGTFKYSNTRQRDSLFDSVNLLATDLTDDSESTASTTQSEAMLNAGDIEARPGGLEVNNAGIDFKITSVKLQNVGGASDDYGRLYDGTAVRDLAHDWATELSTTEGGRVRSKDESGKYTVLGDTFTLTGGPIVKEGTNIFAVTSTAHMEATTPELTAVTRPTLSEFNTGTARTQMSMVYYWAYAPTIFATWYGYGYEVEPYEHVIDIVDIATLIDLINECENTDKYNSINYSVNSWNAFTTALTAAKSEMDYGAMSATAIKDECVTRYNDLWAARRDLKAAAVNTTLKEAVQKCEAAYTNDADKCDPTTFAAFSSAYQAAASKYAGDYSDLNIRNYDKGGPEEQEAASLATALEEAFAALKYYADFSALDLAATNLATSIETKKYPATTLQSIADALAAFPYLNKDAAARKLCFKTTGEDNQQDDIDAEIVSVNALADQLTASTFDDSALQAAITALKAQYKDPDAWQGVNEAVAALESSWYTDVTVYGDVTVTGISYDTQEEVDAATTEILSQKVTPQQYDVYRNGEKIGTYNYGDTVTVHSLNGNVVNWYYAYNSNTASNEKKYFATDESIVFTVKGETHLTTSAEQDSNQENIKITYKNNLNGKPYMVEYAPKGTEYTLNANPPAFSYFQFTNYTDAAGNAITTVNSEENVTVYANYAYNDTTTKYSVTLTGLVYNPNYAADYIKITGLNYNDKVSFVEANMIGNTVGTTDAKIAIDSTSDSVQVNYLVKSTATAGSITGTTGTATSENGVYTIPLAARMQNPANMSTATYVANNDIAYYLSFGSAADCEAYLADASRQALAIKLKNMFTAGTIGKMKIQSFGGDYVFRVHKDEYLMPASNYLTFGFNGSKGSTTGLAPNGMLEGYESAQGVTDVNDDNFGMKQIKPIIKAKETIVKGSGKFSMIGTFSLPEGCTEVEAGILFCSNGTSTPTTADLTLSNVGKDGVARMKSSQHTQANQFVISVNTGSMTGPLGMQYAAYIIYTDSKGKQQIAISDEVSGTFELS